ncbi:unnamed protein product [Vitrella brassicaformis CCMP3155]|uniref:Uncharacterized protein n=4 Tax=Vitrella brassicaformis TaxID=1169539 RepID=A0A0G4F6G7_VITBC|nr:unnamed protein product [Vitrella brassicaformis CCMP3155]|eukprot:CEM08009.1 unnamed protein product [Vitrella brassicaformis CCMP3155]
MTEELPIPRGATSSCGVTGPTGGRLLFKLPGWTSGVPLRVVAASSAESRQWAVPATFEAADADVPADQLKPLTHYLCLYPDLGVMLAHCGDEGQQTAAASFFKIMGRLKKRALKGRKVSRSADKRVYFEVPANENCLYVFFHDDAAASGLPESAAKWSLIDAVRDRLRPLPTDEEYKAQLDRWRKMAQDQAAPKHTAAAAAAAGGVASTERERDDVETSPNGAGSNPSPSSPQAKEAPQQPSTTNQDTAGNNDGTQRGGHEAKAPAASNGEAQQSREQPKQQETVEVQPREPPAQDEGDAKPSPSRPADAPAVDEAKAKEPPRPPIVAAAKSKLRPPKSPAQKGTDASIEGRAAEREKQAEGAVGKSGQVAAAAAATAAGGQVDEAGPAHRDSDVPMEPPCAPPPVVIPTPVAPPAAPPPPREDAVTAPPQPPAPRCPPQTEPPPSPSPSPPRPAPCPPPLQREEPPKEPPRQPNGAQPPAPPDEATVPPAPPPLILPPIGVGQAEAERAMVVPPVREVDAAAHLAAINGRRRPKKTPASSLVPPRPDQGGEDVKPPGGGGSAGVWLLGCVGELVDRAADAGARRVDISHDYWRQCIVVRDDGAGMSSDGLREKLRKTPVRPGQNVPLNQSPLERFPGAFQRAIRCLSDSALVLSVAKHPDTSKQEAAIGYLYKRTDDSKGRDVYVLQHGSATVKINRHEGGGGEGSRLDGVRVKVGAMDEVMLEAIKERTGLTKGDIDKEVCRLVSLTVDKRLVVDQRVEAMCEANGTSVMLYRLTKPHKSSHLRIGMRAFSPENEAVLRTDTSYHLPSFYPSPTQQQQQQQQEDLSMSLPAVCGTSFSLQAYLEHLYIIQPKKGARPPTIVYNGRKIEHSAPIGATTGAYARVDLKTIKSRMVLNYREEVASHGMGGLWIYWQPDKLPYCRLISCWRSPLVGEPPLSHPVSDLKGMVAFLKLQSSHEPHCVLLPSKQDYSLSPQLQEDIQAKVLDWVDSHLKPFLRGERQLPPPPKRSHMAAAKRGQRALPLMEGRSPSPEASEGEDEGKEGEMVKQTSEAPAAAAAAAVSNAGVPKRKPRAAAKQGPTKAQDLAQRKAATVAAAGTVSQGDKRDGAVVPAAKSRVRPQPFAAVMQMSKDMQDNKGRSETESAAAAAAAAAAGHMAESDAAEEAAGYQVCIVKRPREDKEEGQGEGEGAPAADDTSPAPEPVKKSKRRRLIRPPRTPDSSPLAPSVQPTPPAPHEGQRTPGQAVTSPPAPAAPPEESAKEAASVTGEDNRPQPPSALGPPPVGRADEERHLRPPQVTVPVGDVTNGVSPPEIGSFVESPMGVKDPAHHGEEDNITLAVAEADKHNGGPPHAADAEHAGSSSGGGGAEPMEADIPQAASEGPLGAAGEDSRRRGGPRGRRRGRGRRDSMPPQSHRDDGTGAMQVEQPQQASCDAAHDEQEKAADEAMADRPLGDGEPAQPAQCRQAAMETGETAGEQQADSNLPDNNGPLSVDVSAAVPRAEAELAVPLFPEAQDEPKRGRGSRGRGRPRGRPRKRAGGRGRGRRHSDASADQTELIEGDAPTPPSAAPMAALTKPLPADARVNEESEDGVSKGSPVGSARAAAQLRMTSPPRASAVGTATRDEPDRGGEADEADAANVPLPAPSPDAPVAEDAMLPVPDDREREEIGAPQPEPPVASEAPSAGAPAEVESQVDASPPEAHPPLAAAAAAVSQAAQPAVLDTPVPPPAAPTMTPSSPPPPVQPAPIAAAASVAAEPPQPCDEQQQQQQAIVDEKWAKQVDEEQLPQAEATPAQAQPPPAADETPPAIEAALTPRRRERNRPRSRAPSVVPEGAEVIDLEGDDEAAQPQAPPREAPQHPQGTSGHAESASAGMVGEAEIGEPYQEGAGGSEVAAAAAAAAAAGATAPVASDMRGLSSLDMPPPDPIIRPQEGQRRLINEIAQAITAAPPSVAPSQPPRQPGPVPPAFAGSSAAAAAAAAVRQSIQPIVLDTPVPPSAAPIMAPPSPPPLFRPGPPAPAPPAATAAPAPAGGRQASDAIVIQDDDEETAGGGAKPPPPPRRARKRKATEAPLAAADQEGPGPSRARQGADGGGGGEAAAAAAAGRPSPSSGGMSCEERRQLLRQQYCYEPTPPIPQIPPHLNPAQRRGHIDSITCGSHTVVSPAAASALAASARSARAAPAAYSHPSPASGSIGPPARASRDGSRGSPAPPPGVVSPHPSRVPTRPPARVSPGSHSQAPQQERDPFVPAAWAALRDRSYGSAPGLRSSMAVPPAPGGTSGVGPLLPPALYARTGSVMQSSRELSLGPVTMSQMGRYATPAASEMHPHHRRHHQHPARPATRPPSQERSAYPYAAQHAMPQPAPLQQQQQQQHAYQPHTLPQAARPLAAYGQQQQHTGGQMPAFVRAFQVASVRPGGGGALVPRLSRPPDLLQPSWTGGSSRQ